MSTILLIDDDSIIQRAYSDLLKKRGYSVDWAGSARQALAMTDRKAYDLVLCDYRLPDMDAVEFLQVFRSEHAAVPVIVITGYSSVHNAVDVMKQGAWNYLVKPVVSELLLSEVERAIAEAEKERHAAKSQAQSDTGTPGGTRKWISGRSAAAREVQRLIRLVAPTNYSVIIYGESGTGKEATATTIHELSKRKEHPFVAVDCGILSRDLARSELFGHEKGAFTGAVSLKKGQFEIANGGTLFLDEISNLSYDVQGYLLRAIQERKITRMGSSREIAINVRILVASNRKLRTLVREGQFREDLYHRLNELSIELRPLRELKEDLMLFSNHYLELINREIGKKIIGFDEEVEEIFMRYNWPGNLRELNNVVKRAVLLTEGDRITREALHPDLVFHATSVSPAEDTGPPLGEVLGRIGGDSLKESGERLEKEKILRVLKQSDYNKSEAARILKIDRKTLYNKIDKLGIDLGQ